MSLIWRHSAFYQWKEGEVLWHTEVTCVAIVSLFFSSLLFLLPSPSCHTMGLGSNLLSHNAVSKEDLPPCIVIFLWVECTSRDANAVEETKQKKKKKRTIWKVHIPDRWIADQLQHSLSVDKPGWNCQTAHGYLQNITYKVLSKQNERKAYRECRIGKALSPCSVLVLMKSNWTS